MSLKYTYFSCLEMRVFTENTVIGLLARTAIFTGGRH